LIAYRDGALPGARDKAVRAHLAACPLCRGEYERIYLAIALAHQEERAGLSPAASELLARIRTGIEQWQADKQRPEGAAEALKDSVVGQLAPYLGDSGARRLLQTVSPDGHDLFSAIEPVLANFLGDRAASQLVNTIVDTKVMRNCTGAQGPGNPEVAGPLSSNRDSD
jgi:hypothetical protein